MGAVVLSIGISIAGVTIPLLTAYVLEVSKVAAAKVWFGVSLIQAGVSVTLTAAAGLNGELIPSDVVNLAASLVMVVISAIHLHHTIQFSNTQKMLLTSVDENANIIFETGGKKVVITEGGKYTEYAVKATKNPSSAEVVIGKFNVDGVSYVDVAKRRGSTYFQLDNWDQVVKIVGEDNMWNINELFLKQQLLEGKVFFLSHDPSIATGYFAKEVDFLKSRGYGFIKVGTIWKAIK